MWPGVVQALGMLAIAAFLWMLASARMTSMTSAHERAVQVPGLPLIGNTLGLAKSGASFIRKCRLQVEMLVPFSGYTLH